MNDMTRSHSILRRGLVGCVAAGVLGTSLAVLTAQDTQRQDPPRTDTQRQRQGQQAKSVDDLIDQLGDSRYRSRQSAEQDLRNRGDQALPDLRRAAKEHEDAEVRWRAGRLVRQLEGQDQGGLRARDPQRQNQNQRQGQGQPQGLGQGQQPRWGQPGWGQPWTPTPGQLQDLDQMFEQMFQQMERQFGIDIPRRSFFQDPFFQDLQSQMQQRGLGNLQDFEGQGRAMSMRIGSDGVSVTIKEKDESGQVQTRNYEAPDLQSFIQQYPDVAKRLNMTQQSPLPGVRGFLAIPPMPPAIESLPRVQGQQPNRSGQPGLAPRDTGARQAEIPEGQRLGVLVRGEISEDTRAILELPEQGGLLVEEVMDGSLASKLGVKPNDVILEIADTEIVAVEDVQRALAGVRTGEEVTVRVNRRGEEKQLRAKKSSGADESSGGKTQQSEQDDQGAEGKGNAKAGKEATTGKDAKDGNGSRQPLRPRSRDR